MGVSDVRHPLMHFDSFIRSILTLGGYSRDQIKKPEPTEGGCNQLINTSLVVDFGFVEEAHHFSSMLVLYVQWSAVYDIAREETPITKSPLPYSFSQEGRVKFI